MCAFCIPCASSGLPRQVVPQRIPTARPPIRVTVRAIPKAQHRGVSGLTPLFATLPGNPPVSLIIATLPKSCSRNSFVCHTYEPPRGAIPLRRSHQSSPISPLVTRHFHPNPFRMRSYKQTPCFARFWPKLSARNSFRMRSYANRRRNPFRMRTYKKVGGSLARSISPNSYSPFPNFPTCKPFAPATIDGCP